jgi:hypothetical protein
VYRFEKLKPKPEIATINWESLLDHAVTLSEINLAYEKARQKGDRVLTIQSRYSDESEVFIENKFTFTDSSTFILSENLPKVISKVSEIFRRIPFSGDSILYKALRVSINEVLNNNNQHSPVSKYLAKVSKFAIDTITSSTIACKVLEALMFNQSDEIRANICGLLIKELDKNFPDIMDSLIKESQYDPFEKELSSL